jgi:molybdopterin/thiamine biosynthesis adenylyltransferase
MNAPDLEVARLFGDRHLRPDLDDRFGSQIEGANHVVRVSAGADVSQTIGGQHALWMAVNLLARQFAVVHELQVAVPPGPLKSGVALFGEAEDLEQTLVRTGQMVAGNAMCVRAVQGQEACNAEIIVGRSKNNPIGTFSVAALGSGWRVFAGRPESTPAVLPEGTNALGPYFSACLAAGEVFKHLRGLRAGKGRFIDALYLSLWDFEIGDSWDALPEGEWRCPFIVPFFWLIGCGAVGQALAAALAACQDVRTSCTTIDCENVDPTNLNRYPLSTQWDLGQVSKSELTASYLRQGGIQAHYYRGNWPNYATDPSRPAQPEDAEKLESQFRYPLVVSCVDKNSARHAIQNFWPEYLIGGSTSGLAIEVNAYDMRSPFECLKCFNPIEPAGLTNNELVAKLLAMPPLERRVHAEERGADCTALEAYLVDPKCGRLGEVEIQKFRDEGADWSVGFISVAAGTVLTGQLLRFAILGRAAFTEHKGNSLRFSFFNPAPRWTKHLRRAECECAKDGRADYEQLWSSLPAKRASVG